MTKKASLIAVTFLLAVFFPLTTISADQVEEDEKILKAIEDTYMEYSVSVMTGDFNKAYGFLAGIIKKRVSYNSFVTANQLMMKSFLLKASQLSNLRVRGDYAAATAITYIDFLAKKEGEQVLNGKLEAPIFFFKEQNAWKIATGTDEDVEEFLKKNPKARNIMTSSKTRLYYKHKGYWIAFEYNIKEDQKLEIPL